MKKLLFVLVVLCFCSCKNDPRDVLCGKYKYTNEGEYTELKFLREYESRIDGDQGTFKGEGEIIITKIEGEDSMVCIDLIKDRVHYIVYGFITKESEDNIYLKLYDGEIPNVEYSDARFSNNTLYFTSTYESDSEGYYMPYTAKNGITYQVRTYDYRKAKYVAKKIKEQE